MAQQTVSISTPADSFADRPVTSALSGCMYASFVIGVSVLMLLLNALACLTFYSALPKFGPEELSARVGQFFYFTAPIILMVVQWHLIDRVGRMFTGPG